MPRLSANLDSYGLTIEEKAASRKSKLFSSSPRQLRSSPVSPTCLISKRPSQVSPHSRQLPSLRISYCLFKKSLETSTDSTLTSLSSLKWEGTPAPHNTSSWATTSTEATSAANASSISLLSRLFTRPPSIYFAAIMNVGISQTS